jgi:hypothetical protein
MTNIKVKKSFNFSCNRNLPTSAWKIVQSKRTANGSVTTSCPLLACILAVAQLLTLAANLAQVVTSSARVEQVKCNIIFVQFLIDIPTLTQIHSKAT